MLIDFQVIPETVVPHMRGGEKEVANRVYADERCKIARGKLVPGATVGYHTHDTSSEIIYILEGTGKVLYDGAYEEVSVGSCHYCPKGHAHSLINDSENDLIYFAVIPEQ